MTVSVLQPDMLRHERPFAGRHEPGEASPYGRTVSILVVGAADAALFALPDGFRLIGCVAPEQAADHVRAMMQLDILWLADAGMMAAGGLDDLCAAAVERGCGFVCEAPMNAIDRLMAAIPAMLMPQFLVDADPVDRLVALAAARADRRFSVQDVTRDEAMERIDRLQDEVARIGRLLAELSNAPAAGFAQSMPQYGDYSAQVRAPTRDFTVMPRSFVPEERAIDRQRAKAVRRLLRQRRIREQYFPADLFADPAWDMLLDLYASRLERQPVSVSSLCIAAAVPATTALRWIKTMTDSGLFLREADPDDGRRIFIALSDGAFDAMARYFEALEE